MTSAGTLSFTTTHRMINGIHGDTSHVRSVAHPSRASGLTEFLALMLTVADRTYTGPAGLIELAHFA